MDPISYDHVHAVTMLVSAECWFTVHVYATRHWNRATSTSGMDRHILSGMLLLVRQSSPFNMVGRLGWEHQHLRRPCFDKGWRDSLDVGER